MVNLEDCNRLAELDIFSSFLRLEIILFVLIWYTKNFFSIILITPSSTLHNITFCVSIEIKFWLKKEDLFDNHMFFNNKILFK